MVEHLLRTARGGSPEALGQVLATCRNYLLLVANRKLEADLRAKGGASDLVQETFLEAQRDFDRFQGDSAQELRAWLRRILLHNCANFARHYRDVEKRKVSREVPMDDDGPDAWHRNLPADTPSPSSHAVRNEEAEALERALERLPGHYRQVIVWRHRENLSFEEISRLAGGTPDSVRMLWWRAVERLQKELQPLS
jgi:RNA polymerase sigma-70 factor (ECF subfamily)